MASANVAAAGHQQQSPARQQPDLRRVSMESPHCGSYLSSGLSMDSLDSRSQASSSWHRSSLTQQASSALTCAEEDCLLAEETLEDETSDAQDSGAGAQAATQMHRLGRQPVLYSPDVWMDQDMIRNEMNREAECQPTRSSFVPPQVRKRTISWLVEVATHMDLQTATLFLAAAYYDRFLTLSKVLPPGSLQQLLAIGCIMIAAKQEEVQQRGAAHWLQLAPGSNGEPVFTKDDLSKMEYLILTTLKWRTRVPTAHSFLNLLVPVLAGADHMTEEQKQRTACTASFLAELSLLDERLLEHSYSAVSGACVVLAEFLVTQGAGQVSTAAILTEQLHFANDSLRHCVALMHELYQCAVHNNVEEFAPIISHYQSV